MNRMQKIALFNIVILSISLLASTAIVIWLGTKHGYPFALHGYGFLCLGLFHFIGNILFPKKKGDIFDERDECILKQVAFNGESASNTFFIIFFLIAMFMAGLTGTITIGGFGVIICASYIISKLTESISILILYGKGHKQTEGGGA